MGMIWQKIGAALLLDTYLCSTTVTKIFISSEVAASGFIFEKF